MKKQVKRLKIVTKTNDGRLAHTYITLFKEVNPEYNMVLAERYFLSDEIITDAPGMMLVRKYKDWYLYLCVMPFKVDTINFILENVTEYFKP